MAGNFSLQPIILTGYLLVTRNFFHIINFFQYFRKGLSNDNLYNLGMLSVSFCCLNFISLRYVDVWVRVGDIYYR